MIITVAGSGTSHGIPVIGCNCSVCTSMDPKDTRLRSSIFIKGSCDTVVVIDTGPDFRAQALRENMQKLDVLLVTHAHADHIHGLDDIRIFSHVSHNKEYTSAHALELFSNEKCLVDIKTRFDYVFQKPQMGGGKPLIHLQNASNLTNATPLVAGNLRIVHIPIIHGSIPCSGWKITDIATKKIFVYLTDCSKIPEQSLQDIAHPDCLIIDGLREHVHPTHLSFAQSLEYIMRIQAAENYVTHICHEHSHNEIIEWFKNRTDKNVLPAFDGQKIML